MFRTCQSAVLAARKASGGTAISQHKALVEHLSKALSLAKDTASVLQDTVWGLARLVLLPDESKQPGKQQKQEINNIVGTFAPGRTDAPEDQRKVHLEATLADWCRTIRRAAQAAFLAVTRSLDSSARILKAVVAAERTFRWNLKQLLPEKEELHV